jgi:hypothetical protein
LDAHHGEGDVEVTGINFKRVFKAIPNVKDFIDAVQGTHPALQAVSHEKRELEDFVIELPVLPDNISFILQEYYHSVLPEGCATVKRKEWVHKGQTIGMHGAPYGGAKIVTPVSGLAGYVVRIEDKDKWSEQTNWPQHDWLDCAKIRPIKSENIRDHLEGSVQVAFADAVEFAATAYSLKDHKKYRHVFAQIVEPHFGDNLRKEFQMVRDAKVRIIPLSSLHPEIRRLVTPANDGGMG